MTQGIHHITAIASNAQKTLYFYTTILGLRLVKKTVNQDDVGTYHLFFGDKEGNPGMDLTFFIFLPAIQGKRGFGQVTAISFAVPHDSLVFWKNRFDTFKVKHSSIETTATDSRITFFDYDDQQLELVGVKNEELKAQSIWIPKDLEKQVVIRSFYSATLFVRNIDSMQSVLTHVFGYKKMFNNNHEYIFHIPESARASQLVIKDSGEAENGINAAGTVHHIAFRAKNEHDQLQMREKVLELGLFPTDVINRFYFKSVYFRTPGGILFEIATDGPGFTADEKEDELGKKLALPPFLESQREEIESNLQPI